MAGKIQNTNRQKNSINELRQFVKKLYLNDNFLIGNRVNLIEVSNSYLNYLVDSDKNCEIIRFKNKINCCTEIEEITLPILKPCK